MVSDNGVGSQLVKALIEAKKKFKPLVKNKTNPHFRSDYADLAAVHEAVDDALAANGLTVMQPLCFDEKYGHVIKTELLHVSGESKVAVYPLPGGVKSQDLGSAITYGRRYSLSSLLGIADKEEDDDAEADSGRGSGQQQGQAPAQGPKAAGPGKPPPAPKAEPNMWVGAVMKVDNVANGKWKIKGGDAAGTEFGTSTPEHAAVASSSIGAGRVSIKFIVNGNGIKVVKTIEPEKQEGNGNGK
jgi:hypothetical protein